MLKTYTYPKFAYRPAPEQAGAHPRSYPVVIVGAGPVGLSAALDCRRQGLPVVLLDDDDTVSIGSRGVCYAKRTLEVLDRLGVAEPILAKGVTWNTGRTFFGEDEVFNFNLLPEADHKHPGMVNLQQYYLEQFLVERCDAQGVQMRWKHKVVAVDATDDAVSLQVHTPDGDYSLRADWLIVCDGARSPVRSMLGLDEDGRVFTERFLIADVVMKSPFPAERWFWFDPPFHRNQSVLLHREADDVCRIDFQLGWDADPDEERKPENVAARIRSMLGDERAFELEWVSVYTFRCRRMARFNHGRVLFAGDAAHQVSPFGARGANSGIQDADNLVWKLKLVIEGKAPASLLDSYSEERVRAADENILNATRSTDFITPKSGVSRTFRNAVLQLARQHPFARKLVNSGRLSVPTFYTDSTLNTRGDEALAGPMAPGAPMDDAPVALDGQPGWLLEQIGGRFCLIVYADDPRRADLALLGALCEAAVGVDPMIVSPVPPDRSQALPAAASLPGLRVLHDVKGLVARRYELRDGGALLARPDQHLAARWRSADAQSVRAALARATGHV